LSHSLSSNWIIKNNRLKDLNRQFSKEEKQISSCEKRYMKKMLDVRMIREI
jgi:hypothetical protein